MSDLDDQIDHLYQVDLEAFVAERNALAKSAKNAFVKTLVKPSVPAWVVNQIYWKHRLVFSRLAQRGQDLRDEHRKVLSGKPADVRTAETAHRETLREALDVARQVLTDAGHPLTPATIEQVTRTLEALPSEEANGRLAKPLAPTGFEALSGFAALAAAGAAQSPLHVVKPATTKKPEAKANTGAGEKETAKDKAARLARERQERQAQERAEREARERAQREARERRQAAEAAVFSARKTLAAAKTALADAEHAVEMRRRDLDRATTALELAMRALSD